MKKAPIGKIVALVIALIMIGILLPIGLEELVGYDGSYNVSTNGTAYPVYNTGTNATVGTLVASILPILAVIGIIISFIPKGRSEK